MYISVSIVLFAFICYYPEHVNIILIDPPSFFIKSMILMKNVEILLPHLVIDSAIVLLGRNKVETRYYLPAIWLMLLHL